MEASTSDRGEESNPESNNSNNGGDGGGSYDCNICLELAQEPVVTLCGHLFCWPCLYRWLETRSSCKDCPVCKSAVEEAKVIPIYGRGKGSTDPRTKEIPNRPAGRRTDIPQHQRQAGAAQAALHQMGFGFFTGPSTTAQFGNVTLSAGYGLFPFLFGFSASGGFPEFNFGGGGAAGAQQQTEVSNPSQEAVLSKLLLFLGFLVIVCLFFF